MRNGWRQVTVKNAGVGYGDYVEQIAYLLFLKPADEMPAVGFGKVAAASRRSLGCRNQRRDASATLTISNRSALQRVIQWIADEDSLNRRSVRREIGRLGKAHDFWQAGLCQFSNRNEIIWIRSDLLETTPDPVCFQDFLQKLQLVNQRPLGETTRDRLINQSAEVCWNKDTEHPQMFLVLPVGLVEAEKAVALALEEKGGIDDADSLDDQGPLQHLFELSLGNTIDIRHDIDRPLRRAIDREDAYLPIRRRGSADKPPTVFLGSEVLEGGVTCPNIAVLRGEGLEGLERLPCAPGTEILRPEVNRLPAFENVGSPTGTKILQKGEIIAEPGLRHDQRPTACFRLEIRALSKKPAGKMEFSRCKTSGLSPFFRRSASDRREARFSAARDSRSILSDSSTVPENIVPDRGCQIPDKVAAASRRSSSEDQRQDATASFRRFTYAEIVESLEAALEEFRAVEEALLTEIES